MTPGAALPLETEANWTIYNLLALAPVFIMKISNTSWRQRSYWVNLRFPQRAQLSLLSKTVWCYREVALNSDKCKSGPQIFYLLGSSGEGAYLSSSMKRGEQEPRGVSCKPLARCLVYSKSSAIISSFPTPFPFINLNFNILTLLWVHLPSKGKVSTNTSIAYSTLTTEQLEL